MQIIGCPIHVLTWKGAVETLVAWSRCKVNRVVCICNTHSLVTAKADTSFAAVLHNSDMNTPDGAPVAALMRFLGAAGQQRINGPDLMWRVCKVLNHPEASSIFLYGSSPSTLELLENVLKAEFPNLNVAGSYSPPYRQLSDIERSEVRVMIAESGAGLVWVSLGCPKQELWMESERAHIGAVLVGVGAAFDYHAGTLRRAPLWMRNCGLEWLHRLAMEPRRLWKRYLVNNTLFIYWAAMSMLAIMKEKFIRRHPN